MAINFQPLVAESLAKQIAENIRSSILDGSLKVDDQLPTEEVLAAKFNVSRPTIREALKRLAAQNLIRSRRGPTGGTFVNRPSQEELRSSLAGAAMLMVSMGKFSLSEIAEARRELELPCCRLATKKCVATVRTSNRANYHIACRELLASALARLVHNQIILCL